MYGQLQQWLNCLPFLVPFASVSCSFAEFPGPVNFASVLLVPCSGPALDIAISSAGRRGHEGMRNQLMGWLISAPALVPFAIISAIFQMFSGPATFAELLQLPARLAKNGPRLARRSRPLATSSARCFICVSPVPWRGWPGYASTSTSPGTLLRHFHKHQLEDGPLGTAAADAGTVLLMGRRAVS